jgi:UDP-glucose 4-epimerase
VETLVKKGEKVRVLDNLSTGKEDNLKPFMDKIEFIKGDIRNSGDLKDALREVDYVSHQAALRSVARSVEDPVASNDVNVTGTLDLLMEAKEAGVKRLVYASSSSAYGRCEKFPQKEDFTPDPISPYAVSKLAAEYYCRMFSITMGFETVSLRYFNVFGPRQNPESKYSAVIPAFIDALINDKACIIHGDGTQSRDFTFVSNVVDANLAACEAENASGLVFNVACGEEHSIIEIADHIKKDLGKDIDHVFEGRRAGDVDRTSADVSRLRDILGINEQVSFYEGLSRTVKWFKEEYKGD